MLEAGPERSQIPPIAAPSAAIASSPTSTDLARLDRLRDGAVAARLSGSIRAEAGLRRGKVGRWGRRPHVHHKVLETERVTQ